MKIRILIGGSIFFVITLLSFMANFSIAEENDFSTLLANVEAIASSSEGGGGTHRVKHATYGGKQYKKGKVTWERSGVGDSCIRWDDFLPLGNSNGHCYTYE